MASSRKSITIKTENINFSYTLNDIADITQKIFRLRLKITKDATIKTTNYIEGCTTQIKFIIDRLKTGEEVKLEIPKNALLGIKTNREIEEIENELIMYIEKKLNIKVKQSGRF